MESKDLVQKGNTLKMMLTITTQAGVYSTKTSLKYVINGVVKFKVRLIPAKLVTEQRYNGNYAYNYMVLVQFTRHRPDDDLTYNMKLTSIQLEITGNNFTCDDNNIWHLIHESTKPQFSFDLAVDVEVVASMSSFASLHKDTELTDFELRGEDGSVHVHRAVLAAASPMLRRMLGGAWREAREGYVDVPGTLKITLQHFKYYLYLLELPDVGLEQLLLLASYYIMPALEQKCVDKMVRSVTPESAADMIEFAAKHKVTSLLLAVLDCVQNGVIKVSDMRDFFMGAHGDDN